MTARLTTRPRRRQGYTAWLAEWDATCGIRSFTAGNITGVYVLDDTYYVSLPDGHRLDRDEQVQWNDDKYHIRYYVMSYRTPVAWCTDDAGWYFVQQRFSPTTTRHINLITNAINRRTRHG